MKSFQIMLVIMLLVVGIACLGVGVYTYQGKSIPSPTPTPQVIEKLVYVTPTTAPTPSSQTFSTNSVSKGNIASIPGLRYISAQWDEYGPGYDGPDRSRVWHIWGRAIGFFTYQIQLPKTGISQIIITARLSSELNKATSTNPRDSSDVTLLINGQEIETKNIVPDNLVGEEYQWIVPSTPLQSGPNEITFRVGTGNYNNGLAIYGPIQVGKQ